MIQIYKKYISPLWIVIFGPTFGCRFYPTCSEYTHQAVIELGIKRGLIKGVLRIMRCNPLFKGGVDLPV